MTLALLLPLKNRTIPLLPAAGILLLCGTLVSLLGDTCTRKQLRQGKTPDHLLQQYYRGSTDLRECAAELWKLQLQKGTVILTDPYDFPTMQFYWSLYGHDPQDIIASNLPQAATTPCVAPVIIARTPEIARNILNHTPQKNKELKQTDSHFGTRMIFFTVDN